MTPEGRVKAKVRATIEQFDGSYQCWPVFRGLGKTTVDLLGCYRGRFFGVETKAPGKKPTLRQQMSLKEIAAAGGETFVIDDVDCPELLRLEAWLIQLRENVHDVAHIPRDTVHRRRI